MKIGVIAPGASVYQVVGTTNNNITVPQAILDGYQIGDLLGMIVECRRQGAVTSVTGLGQTWTLETEVDSGAGTAGMTSIFVWAFLTTSISGTTILVSYNVTNDDNIIGFLWRRNVSDTTPGSPWDDGGVNFAAPGSPFDISRAGQTTTIDMSEVIYSWATVDDNTWSLSTANGCDIYGQTVATAGLDMSQIVVGKIVSPAGASGTTTARQATLGGDAGCNHVITLRPKGHGWIRPDPMMPLLPQ